MNAEPHTHDVKIHEDYDYYLIKYGDQSKKVGKRFCSAEWVWRRRNATTLERLIRRRTRKLIRRHDKQSWKAGQRVISPRELADSFNQHLLNKDDLGYSTTKKDVWGAELLHHQDT